jgi:thiamine-phosphate pyrophosphorylase
MDTRILRMLDASANRAREALRVLEDGARFARDDRALTQQLKSLRHDLALALGRLPMALALQSRDTAGDVGTTVKTETEFQRLGLREVIIANAKRLSEALRSLEECAKTLEPTAAAQLEQLRYRGYTLEQTLSAAITASTAEERFRQVRLYVLLTDAHCGPRGWELTLEEILDAGAGKGGGGETAPLCIQLREKALPDRELLRRATVLARKCAEAGALSILNDRPDIALLAGCSGVHVGQDDLPCAAARKVLGTQGVIGVSTERIEQARQAVAEGATYVAAGPMFHTTTKDKPRIVGPAYAQAAVRELPVPVVAIGGITLENIGALTSAGVRAVAVSAAILRAAEPGKAVRAFLDALAA